MNVLLVDILTGEAGIRSKTDTAKHLKLSLNFLNKLIKKKVKIIDHYFITTNITFYKQNKGSNLVAINNFRKQHALNRIKISDNVTNVTI